MKCRLIFCFLFFLVIAANVSHAQSVEERMTQKHPNCTDVFLNAMNIMPGLYRHKFFDSLHTALAIWRSSCGNIPEVGCTELLLSIEESRFDERRMDSSTIDLLVNYSYGFSRRNRMNIPEEERSFFTFISTWASLLLRNLSLIHI